jgi:hypothetical protein
MFTHMTRIVKERVRYYNISLEKNLFDEYIVTKEYGSLLNKRAINTVMKIFLDIFEAKRYFENERKRKLHKGYIRVR